MIHRTDWRNLDDCNKGCPEHLVDWTGCSDSLKEFLIQDYNMGCQVGYQPKNENEIKYWYNNYDKVVESFAHCIGWIGYPIFVYFFLWGVLMTNGLPIAAAIFAVAVCIVPAVIVSVIAGGALGLTLCIICEIVHEVVLKKRAKKQAKQDEFDNFIKGCRNGSN